MEIRRIIGNNVRYYRIIKGVRQRELGLESGLNPSYVSQIERGVCNPTIETLDRLAKALVTAPLELLKKEPTGKRVRRFANTRSLLAKNIWRYRNLKRLSQEALGFEADMSTSYISGIEHRLHNPSAEAITRIAKALDLEPYQLLEKPEK